MTVQTEGREEEYLLDVSSLDLTISFGLLECIIRLTDPHLPFRIVHLFLIALRRLWTLSFSLPLPFIWAGRIREWKQLWDSELRREVRSGGNG